MREVRATKTLELGVEVREVAALEQRVVGEVDAGDDVLRAEGDLLGLGEEVVDSAVEHEAAHAANRDELLGDDLRGVEDVEVERVGELVVEQLEAQLPLREVAAVDRVPQIAPMEVGVGTVDLDRLVPHHRLHAQLRLPMELHERRLASGVDEAEAVHPETLHEPEGTGDRPVRHRPHDHVGRFGHQRDEVPEVVVRRLRLGKAAVRGLLDGVDEVGELDRVLDEEHRDVVADEIPVAFLRVELDGEAADVTGEVERSLVPGNRREAHEHRCSFAGALEQVGASEIAERLIRFEEPVGSEAAGVDDTFGDPLVIEVEDLLAEVEVLQQRRPTLARTQCVLVVGNRSPLLRRQPVLGAGRRLMRLATSTDLVDQVRGGHVIGRRVNRRVGRALVRRRGRRRASLGGGRLLGSSVFLGAVFFGAMATIPYVGTSRTDGAPRSVCRVPESRRTETGERPRGDESGTWGSTCATIARCATVIEQRVGDSCSRRRRSPEGQD